jgi:hypothetical protein
MREHQRDERSGGTSREWIAVTKRSRTMTIRHITIMGLAVMILAAGPQAQTTQTKQTTTTDSTQFTTMQLRGDVVMTEGNLLLVRMTPSGEYRYFNVQPGRQFIIDGKPTPIGGLKPGTSLLAMVNTRTESVTVRTTSVLNGTVWYASGNYVILTLPNGENREYKVPESYRFMVEGNKEASVGDLRKGMKVSATKIVAEPRTEISSETVVTGTAPR